ncbi:MAG: gliding motility-associated C-terminal domain-containing protein [Flavobacteriales bacterium]|nr:gliding motility-associated C-terminal domain-containing protein [Flavobacteriales bacterium]
MLAWAFAVLFGVGHDLNAQTHTWNWSYGLNSSDPERFNSLAVDEADASIYAVGDAENTNLTIGPLNLLDEDQGLIVKYDSWGNTLWYVPIGGSDQETAENIAVGPNGNVYVSGAFEGACYFYNAGSSVSAGSLVSFSGSKDIYLAAFNSSGQFLWAQQFGNGNDESMPDIAVDATGIALVARYLGTFTMGSSTSASTLSSSVYHVALAHFDLNGTFQWMVTGGSSQEDFVSSVASDGSRIYVGLIHGNSLFRWFNSANTVIATHNLSRNDHQYAAFSTTGAWLWSTGITDPSSNLAGYPNVAVGCGGLYISGALNSGSSFPNGITATGSSGNQYFYAARLSTTTGSTEWAKVGGTLSGGDEFNGRDISIGKYGTVHIGGTYKGTATFGTSSMTSSNGTDMFVMALRPDGTLNTLLPINSTSNEYLSSIAADAFGGVVIAGSYQTSLNIPGFPLTGAGNDNGFVAFSQYGTREGELRAPSNFNPPASICAASGMVDLTTWMTAVSRGAATAVITATASLNTSSALGLPDNVASTLTGGTGALTLDLGTTVSAGEFLRLRWRRNTAAANTPTLTIQTSPDNSAWTTLTTSISASRSSYLLSSLTTTAATRYVRIQATSAGGTVDIDALQYLQGTLNGGSWSGAGVTGTSFNPSALSGSTSITYTVGNAPCTYTTTKNINIVAAPQGGTLSGGGTYCPGSTGTLSLSGHSGTIVQWERSSDGINWSNFANNASTFTWSGLTSTNHFRVVLRNGPCADAISTVALVNVKDVTSPVITNCPGDRTLFVQLGRCAAEWTVPALSYSDNCSITPVVAVAPNIVAIPISSAGTSIVRLPPGTTAELAPGQYQFVDTVFDAAHNKAVCSYRITVRDTIVPRINCPANMVVPTDATSCGSVVNYPEPTITDECDVCHTHPGLASHHSLGAWKGHTYYASSSPVTYDEARTAAANMGYRLAIVNSAQENLNLSQLLASNGITDAWIGLSDEIAEGDFVWSDGSTLTTTSWAPSQPDNGGDQDAVRLSSDGLWHDESVGSQALYIIEVPCGPLSPTLTAGPASGAWFPAGNSTIQFQTSDAFGNSSSCAFVISVIDQSGPVFINCPDTVRMALEATDCSIAYVLPLLNSTDDCDPDTEEGSRISFLGSDSLQRTDITGWNNLTLGKGIHHFTDERTDDAGNVSSCSWVVIVADTSAPSFTCPLYDDYPLRLDGTCRLSFPDLRDSVTVTDCSPWSNSMTPAPNSTFQSDTALVMRMWIADALGNGRWNEHSIRVVDMDPPTFTAPSSRNAIWDSSSCTGLVPDLVALITDASDNCCTPHLQQTPAAGEIIISDTTVTISAVDSSGNITTHIVDIHLAPPPPSVVCPTSISASTSSGTCTAVINRPGLDATSGLGACESWSETAGPTAWNSVPLGTTEVTYLIRTPDDSTTCIFDLIVVDGTAPTILCPSDTIISLLPGECSRNVAFAASADDECTFPTITYSAPPNSLFPEGVNTVSCAASDGVHSTGCSFTIEVIGTAPVLSYSNSTLCGSSPLTHPSQPSSPTGTFSSSAGLMIDASSGAIDPQASSPGTYTVVYTTPGTCNNTASTSVTITPAQTANISYPDSPFCTDMGQRSVVMTGTNGGTFSGTSGLSVDPSTGVVDPALSTPGNHAVTYVIAASGGCALFQTTAPVTITGAPSASISYSGSPYCGNAGTATSTLTGTVGGTYNAPAGLSLNASTGTVDLASSVPGTYTVTYTLAATAGCAQFQTTASITVSPAPIATIAYTGSPYCSVPGSALVNRSGLAGGFYSSTAGLTINGSNGTVALGTSTPGTYTVTYTIPANGGCGLYTRTTSITINAHANAGADSSLTICSNITSFNLATLERNADSGGIWKKGTNTIFSGIVDPSYYGTGTFVYRYVVASPSPCPADSALFTVSYVSAPTTGTSSPMTVCNGTGVMLTDLLSGETPGGTWRNSADQVISGTVFPTSDQAYNYSVTGHAACPGATDTVNVTVAQPANAGNDGALTICELSNATSLFAYLTGSPSTGGTWNGPSSLAGGNYDPSINAPGDYTYTIAATSPCAAGSATVHVSETPALSWYADIDGDDVGSGSAMMSCSQPAGYVLSSHDQCPTDPNKIDPGMCGCGLPEADSDGDGVPDCIDPCPIVPDAAAGDPCDDGDPTTGNDAYNGTCQCVGQPLDCAGVVNGTATIDACGTCTGGTTGITPNATCTDCAGVVNGTATIDACGTCAGGTTGITPNAACTDCAGVVNGTATIDACGTCAGGTTGITPNATCTDCAGVVNGTATIDACGTCVGGTTGITPNATCTDCAGVVNGTASIDACGTCTGGTTGITPNATCTDCAGVVNGTATIDACGTCAGGTTGITPNATCTDCAGVVNGTASIDACGTCTGGTTGITPNSTCLDCAGIPNGTSLPGTACDDNNANTTGDTWTNDCNCVGTTVSFDCAGVPNGTSLPGTACDDNNANTTGDTWTNDCNCVGTTVSFDCAGVPNGTSLPGTACDDNNANTTGDTWTNDCNCVGTVMTCSSDAGPDQTLCSPHTTLAASGTGSWSGPTEVVFSSSNSPNSSIDIAAPGSYELAWTVTIPGCTSTDMVTIVLNEQHDASFTYPASAFCQDHESVEPVAASSMGTFTSATGISVAPTTGTITPGSSIPGSHVITHTISGACPTSSDLTIVIAPSPNAAWNAPATVCSNDELMDLSGSVTGDPNGTWSGDGVTGTVFDPSVVSGSTLITRSITWGACTSSAPATIMVQEAPIANAGPDVAVCGYETMMAAELTSGQGSWTIAPLLTTAQPNLPNALVSGTVAGSYGLVWMVSDEGCSATDTAQLILHDPADALELWAGVDQLLEVVTNTEVSAQASPGATVEWSLVSGSGQIAEPHQPFTSVTGLELGTNTLVATVSLGQCIGTSDTLRIVVEDLFIPQGFSPNGDGDNDRFEVTGMLAYPGSQLSVFNRWGQKVYENDSYMNDWEGRSHSGQELPNDTYFFVLNLSGDRAYNGFVVIKR